MSERFDCLSADELCALCETLLRQPFSSATYQEIGEALDDLATAVPSTKDEHHSIALLANLARLGSRQADELDKEGLVALEREVTNGTEALLRSFKEDESLADFLSWCRSRETTWSDFLTPQSQEDPYVSFDMSDLDEPDSDIVSAPEPDEALTAEDITSVLAVVSQCNNLYEEDAQPDDQPQGEQVEAPSATSSDDAQPLRPASFEIEWIDDEELRVAFLDDCARCLESMEEALVSFESAPEAARKDHVNQFARELHTLKGASSSVGLSSLANYLHELEDELTCEEGSDQTTGLNADALLTCVDVVRQQVSELLERTVSNVPPAEDTNYSQREHASPETVRVKSSQVDRLMDMLAELVMLRNERDARIDQLRAVDTELLGCIADLRMNPLARGPADQANGVPQDPTRSLTDLARTLRSVYESFATENLTISRFIRQFRNELVEIRRVPVAGLFGRLQRAVRDVAKSENKAVQFELEGTQTTLDRSLLEQLYDPLLHIVRNAITHGIESPEMRQRANKDPLAKVTLTVSSGTNFVTLSVSDDGQGLDFDALRRRGGELRLLPRDRVATHQELSKLIFHPGFSTRDSASTSAGRGVGMDVVAKTLESLCAWIDVESESGLGTTIRITVPQEHVIEHVLMVRSNGQLFALPMKSVRSTGENRDADIDNAASYHLAALLGQSVPACSTGAVVRIGDAQYPINGEPSERSTTLIVDEIIGPEEVVTRPMPKLLAHQRLFSGVSLAGSGETVLICNSRELLDRSHQTDVQQNSAARDVSRESYDTADAR